MDKNVMKSTRRDFSEKYIMLCMQKIYGFNKCKMLKSVIATSRQHLPLLLMQVSKSLGGTVDIAVSFETLCHSKIMWHLGTPLM